MLPITYLLPIRCLAAIDDELSRYLATISRECPVVVVDGSDEAVFAANHAIVSTFARHLAPDPRIRCANGKVRNVLTGLAHVTTETVVIADDDVRYQPQHLTRLVDELATAELVVPQNYFDPSPWHARWDTGRTLLNRVTGGDFPGTLAARTAFVADGYDGDVLFENLELIRTVTARGGRCRRVDDLYVQRRPPTSAHFAGQRVRQAYDEWARPRRMIAWLLVLPGMLLAARRWRPSPALGALAVVAAAEAGRRRHGGRRFFPSSSSLLAPLWVAERAVCIWLAALVRMRGGVRYGGTRIVRAANSPRSLAAAVRPAA